MNVALWLAGALAITGCGGDKGARTSVDDGGARPGADDVLAVAGEGTVVLAMWPAHWKRLGGLESEIAAALPEAQRAPFAATAGEARATIETPWAAVRAIARRLRLPAPEKLGGMDATRPLVISALTPALPLEESIAAVTGDSPAIAVHSRLVIPASDPGVVRDELERALGGDRKLARLAGGLFGDDERLVRLIAGGSWVAVDVALGSGLDRLDEAGRGRVLGPARRAAGAHPLLSMAEPSAARLHIRLDRLGAAGAAGGLVMIASVRSVIAESNIRRMLMQGIAEVLTAPLVADPAGTLFTDAVLDIPAGAPPALYLAATDRGRAALAVEPALASGTSLDKIDLAAISAKAPLAPILADARTVADLVTPIHECGYACSLYLGLGNGLGLIRAAEAVEPGALATIKSAIGQVAPLLRARLTLAGSVLLVEPLGASKGAIERARTVRPRPAAATSPCHARALLALRAHLRLAVEAEPARTGETLDRFAASTDLACDPRLAAIRAAVTSLRAQAE